MNFRSQWPCECGEHECEVRMGGNLCVKCRTIRGQGRIPIRAIPAVNIIDTRKQNNVEHVHTNDKSTNKK